MDTREKLLAAAARLFQLKGYNGTGLSEILAASGAPRGSLYYYFPRGKVQLAVEAVRSAGSSINERVAGLLAAEADPVRAVRRVVEDIVDGFHSGTPGDISLSMMAVEASSGNEPLRRACEDAFDERERLFVDKLATAGYPADDARRLGALVQVLIEGAIVASRTRADPKALLDVADLLPRLLSPSSAN